MQTTAQADPIYWLERTDTETQRLIRQGSYYNPFTRRFFVEAGIVPGMRVLDVGSGAGDVALLAAELVGPTGQVVGVDLNPAVLVVARERARAAGHANVEFAVGDVRELAQDKPFDAVVGRFILLYLADPAVALRAFVSRVKPGGIVAFQDFTIRPAWQPDSALWRQTAGWILAVGQRARVELAMGDKLRQTFLTAGLPEPRLHLEARIGGGPDYTGYEELASVVRSMLPLILKFGIATAAEVDIDTLEDRLRAETVAANGAAKGPDLVSAWTRLPLPAARHSVEDRATRPVVVPDTPAANTSYAFGQFAMYQTDLGDLLSITQLAL
ncbi:MAG TPA: methyltransferase domain-containing protein [Thermomicrobiales bacterium]|nr:methyltransferase domain-containing protein [Thermomicrobiales bacterium]